MFAETVNVGITYVCRYRYSYCTILVTYIRSLLWLEVTIVWGLFPLWTVNLWVLLTNFLSGGLEPGVELGVKTPNPRIVWLELLGLSLFSFGIWKAERSLGFRLSYILTSFVASIWSRLRGREGGVFEAVTTRPGVLLIGWAFDSGRLTGWLTGWMADWLPVRCCDTECDLSPCAVV